MDSDSDNNVYTGRLLDSNSISSVSFHEIVTMYQLNRLYNVQIYLYLLSFYYVTFSLPARVRHFP